MRVNHRGDLDSCLVSHHGHSAYLPRSAMKISFFREHISFLFASFRPLVLAEHIAQGRSLRKPPARSRPRDLEDPKGVCTYAFCMLADARVVLYLLISLRASSRRLKNHYTLSYYITARGCGYVKIPEIPYTNLREECLPSI